MKKTIFTGCLEVFSISENRFLHRRGTSADLSDLEEDAYITFSLWVENNSEHAFSWNRACVRVDGGESWGWASGQIPPFGRTRFRIARHNMEKCLTPGVHRAVWYFDGRQVHEQTFRLTRSRQWEKVFPIPSRDAIERYQRGNRRRSPYLSAWLQIPSGTRYTQYTVDFRADHLPTGTYCCLGNWTMDLSCLKKKYTGVRTAYPGVNAYAGFQKTGTGEMVSIMSFWDIFCRDASGRETVIRARRLYPENVIRAGSFSGEGTGARCLASYPWRAGRWYRMQLSCVRSDASGNTLVEQWVSDLETGVRTLLCRFDTGLSDSAFQGSIAVFLENFQPETAGELRSMQVRNAAYFSRDAGRWIPVTSAYVSSQGGLPQYEGSYRFGASGNALWMITSGVGGDWFSNGKGQQGTYVALDGR